MSPTAWVFACSTTLVVACAAQQPAGPATPAAVVEGQARPDPQELEKAGRLRKAQVRAEIERRPAHPWAGVYRTKDFFPHELALAPDAGFTFYMGSGCGNCARYAVVGRVSADRETVLELTFELAEDPTDKLFAVERGLLGETLHLVRWGDLLFAVPEQSMELFCAEVADGMSFPEVPFRFVGDRPAVEHVRPARPAGLPEVPSEYERLMPEQPVSCGIASVFEWQPHPELDCNGVRAYHAVYSLDAGSNAGLVDGMHLLVDDSRSGRGRVERVEAERAHLRVLVFENNLDWAIGLVGKRASSLRTKR